MKEPKEKTKQICKDIYEGEIAENIAKKYNCTKQAINSTLKTWYKRIYNEPYDPLKKQKDKKIELSKKFLEYIKTNGNGESLRKISKKLGVSVAILNSALSENNVKYNRYKDKRHIYIFVNKKTYQKIKNKAEAENVPVWKFIENVLNKYFENM